MRQAVRASHKALRPAAPPRVRKARLGAAVKPARPSVKTTLRAASKATRRPAAARATGWISGIAITPAGARHWKLHRPVGVRAGERLPLVVMLHGCDQDAQALATVSRMNAIADRERFLVLYPEQDRSGHPQRCWNWYDTRSGRAFAEARIVLAAIDQVCAGQPVDPARVGVAGLSAGASLGALLATRHPERIGAVAMHSGIAPGAAHSTATALSAMRGERTPAGASRQRAEGASAPGIPWPPLLVIHGLADRIVAPSNGRAAAQMWAEREAAQATLPRKIQRGARLSATLTDHRTADGRLVATLCEIDRLGHAWSGGAAGQRYSNPKGPDAARMIWAFFKKRFAVA